jgi:large subunit ribosomal protein L17
LILHKRIFTTVAKAKALRKFIEPIITKSKQDSTHARRVVFSHFQDKEPVKILFNEIAYKIGDRPGGYTRIIKMGNRLGDNAEMCMIELVDYNELLQQEPKLDKKKTRRQRGKNQGGKVGMQENLVEGKQEPVDSQEVAFKNVENIGAESVTDEEAPAGTTLEETPS